MSAFIDIYDDGISSVMYYTKARVGPLTELSGCSMLQELIVPCVRETVVVPLPAISEEAAMVLSRDYSASLASLLAPYF